MGITLKDILDQQEVPMGEVVQPKATLNNLLEGTYKPTTPKIIDVEKLNLPYTEDDLVKDQYFIPISRYMKDRKGVDNIRFDDRRSVVESFMNNMRGFAGGNSVRAVSELRYLNNLEEGDPKLAAAGEAYQIFEGMSGLFSGEVSFLEGAEIVQDYTRTALLDPVNLLAGWVGKVLAGGGTRAVVQTAKTLAKEAFKRKLAAGVSEEVAQEAAKKTFDKFIARVGRKTATSKLLRDTGVKAIASKEGIRYIAGSTITDSLAAVGTDIAYQSGLIHADAQEDYSELQTGLAALGGLVMGGISAGRIAARGTQNIVMPDLMVKFKDSKVKSKDAVKALADSLSKLNKIEEGDWAKKVTEGRKLNNFDPEFWEKFILGDKAEVKGLAQILYEDGYRWSKRSEDDNITNFLSDFIKSHAEGGDLKPLLKELNDITGEKYTAKEFSDSLTAHMSKAGKGLAVSSQARKLLKEGVDPTVEKILDAELSGIAALRKFGGQEIGKLQNNLIRLLVSNPATTLRNIRGWGAYSTMNSITDIVQSSLYGGAYLITGNKASLRKASAFAKSQRAKFASLVDPDMSHESFMSMYRLHQKQFDALARTHAGGVIDTTDFATMAGVHKGDNVITMLNTAFDRYTDFANTVSGVKLQDSITKSIEFNYQMDKHLRLKFGIGAADFYAQPNVSKSISTEDYAWALTRSIGETEKSIFGKSYRGKGFIGEIAGAIEDIRKIPGVGLTMPFGRFFNNTVAFLSDHTGLSLASKAFVGNDRDVGELAVRTAVGLTAISAFMWEDVKNMREGKPLNPITHMEIPGGRTMDVTSEFPIAPMKAIARSAAYGFFSEEKMSTEEADEVFKLLTGQITRNMTSSAKELNKVAISMIKGESADFGRNLVQVLAAIPSQGLQSATRWIDPINEAAGLLRGEKATVSDRRQGKKNLNNSLRYLDQILESIGLDVNTQKYSASVGKVTRRPSAVLGSKDIEYTNSMKLMDSVGIPYYLLDSYTKVPEADNRWNQIFFEVFNDAAGDLLQQESFQKAKLKGKREDFNDLKEGVREQVYAQLERSMEVDDPRYAYLLKIAKQTSWSDIDSGLKDLGLDKDFEDLDLQELEIFKYWLDNQKDINKTITETK